MSEDWKTQLKNEDPRIRVEAIKAMANSGDRAYLPFLKEVVENDIDPRVQDYARKAARHLFTTTEGPIPEKTPPQPDPEPVREQQPPVPESEEAALGRSLPPGERTAAETKIQRALSLHMRGDTQKALKAFAQGLDLDPNLSNETFTRSVASELTGLSSDQALDILMDPEERKELLATKKKNIPETPQEAESEGSPRPEKPRKPRGGIMGTWLSFFSMTEDMLADEAKNANTEDTFLSILVFTIASVVISMIAGFIQFQRIMAFLPQIMAEMGEEMPPLDINFGVIFIVMFVATLIMTPLFFFIASGLQFLSSKLFGGSGDFKSHFYLLALIQVPVTVLGGVISFLSYIPGISFLAGLVSLGLLIFTLIINIRAVKAVHNIGTGRAVGAVILLPIILAALGGCLVMFFGSALISALAGLG